MVKNEYSLIIDIKKITTNITPTFIQYDNAILYFNVYDNGRRVDLSPITSVQVTHKRPDGKVIIGEGSIETNGRDTYVKYEYLGSEMKKAGFVNTSVTLLSGQDKVTSFPFTVRILPDLREGISETSKEELALLDRLFKEVSEYQEYYTENYPKIEDIIRRSEESLDRLEEIELAEDIREQSESQRTINEDARILAEDARIQEEQSRLDNEETRIAQETSRNEAEALRRDSHTQMKQAEDARRTEESARVERESLRESSERERVENESLRQLAEDERNTSEDIRNASEQARVTSEEYRQANETERQQTLDTMNESESVRLTNETTRNEQESLRLANEQARITEEDNRNVAEQERKSQEDERLLSEADRQEKETERDSFEQIRRSQETARMQAEDDRNTSETLRNEAEDVRLASETERQTQEQIRISNEDARSQEEDTRKQAEALRLESERTREAQELTRNTEETNRINNESERNEAEEARKLAETERNTFESERQANETERIAQENNRIEAELLRVDSETIRVTYEDTRQENERLRTEAEEARQQQEAVRNQGFDERIEYFDELVPLIDNLEFVGPYDINTNYLKNNIVSFNGSSFIALEDSIGQPLPNTIEKENDYWALVALRGVDGRGSISTVNGLSPDTDGNLELYLPNKGEDVGLGQVDNTADLDKPVSNPQRTAIDEMGRQTLDSSKQYTDQRISDIVDSAPEALDTLSELASAINENESSYDSLLEIVGEKAKITDLQAHINDQENPHKVTKEQVGLGNVDNTSDMDKPVSNPQQSAIAESSRVVKSYVDERITETTGSMRIESYEQLITATEENQTLFPIQDSFNPNNDTLFVFVDGEALSTEEYSITPLDENGSSSLELVNGVPIDALIRLVIIGNLPTSSGVLPNIRGSLIIDGTIPQEKLTEALSKKIDEKAEKTSFKEALTSIKEYGAIGDGRDSRTAFQEAFNTSTGTVLIPEGIYTLKEIHLDKDLRIVGTGKKSTLKLPTDLTTEVRGVFGGVEGGLNAMFYVNGGVQITFENLTFDGDFFNQVEPYNGGTFLRIFKPTLSENERVVINFRNCRFLNVNHSAMQAYGTATKDSIFINISDCIFEGGAKGTHTEAIPDKWAYGFAPHFIGLYDDVTLSVIGSKFIDDILPDNTNTFARIALYTSVTATSTVEKSDQYSSSIVFLDNIFKGLGRSERAGNGLGVLDMYVNGENAIISGNKFFSSQMQSIRGKVNVKNLIVTENIIQDGIDGAIAFHPNNYASKKGVAVIANNIINNCRGYGVLLNGDSKKDTNPFFENAIVEGNIIKGITVVLYRETLANGIFLKKVRDVTVSGNQFLDIQYDGVYIEDAENIKIEGNTIKTSTTETGIGRGIYGTGLTGTIAIQENDIKANVSAIYLSFSSSTEIKKKQLLINNNTISEVRTASGQAVYVANFLVAIVSSNIIEGMKRVEGTTPYAFNFKGNFLNLISNIYVDITGENGDPTGTQYGLKLKGNVTNLREVANSWQTA